MFKLCSFMNADIGLLRFFIFPEIAKRLPVKMKIRQAIFVFLAYCLIKA